MFCILIIYSSIEGYFRSKSKFSLRFGNPEMIFFYAFL